MSDSTNYDLVMTGAGFDPEYIMFRLHRDVPDARQYIDPDGKSTGAGYDWRAIEADMRSFSQKAPEVLFLFTEYGAYDNISFENRHYFRAGHYALVEPIVTKTWPELSEVLGRLGA